MENTDIGERLKLLRISKGIRSVDLLSIRANANVFKEKDLITPGYIRRLESGVIKSPGLEILVKLAKGFNVTVGELSDYLTGKKEIPPAPPPTLAEMANALVDYEE